MSTYSIQNPCGHDFICVCRDHSKRCTVTLLVRADDERAARREFAGERSFSVLSIRAK